MSQIAKAYPMMSALGQDRFNRIRTDMVMGSDVPSVVGLVVDEWGMFKDQKGDLKKELTKFHRKEVVPVVLGHQKTALSLKRVSNDTQAVVEKLDVLEELSGLLDIQRDRLQKGLEVEKGAPLPIKAVDVQVGLQLKLLAQIAELQLETGDLDRAPSEMSGLAYRNEETGEVSFTAQIRNKREAREKALEILDILEGRVEIEDAEYEPIPDNGESGGASFEYLRKLKDTAGDVPAGGAPPG